MAIKVSGDKLSSMKNVNVEKCQGKGLGRE